MHKKLQARLLLLKKERVLLTFATLLLLLALFFNGLLPGQISSLANQFTSYGAMGCGAIDTQSLLQFRCGLTGGETGQIYTLGYPFTFTTSMLLKFLPFLGQDGVFFIVGLLIFGLSLFAFYKICRRLGINKYLAVIAGTIFLLSPIIISLKGFGGTGWGTVLLPLYIYIPLFCMDKFAEGAYRTFKKALPLIGLWTAVNTIAIFMDGYSFFMAQAIMAAVGLMYIVSYRKDISTWVAAGSYCFANAAAYLLFTNLTSIKSALPGAPIEMFRAMGADLVSFVVPSMQLWWNGTYRLSAGTLWGDGTNNMGNYAGFLLMFTVVVGLVLFVKQKKKKDSWLILGILLAMVVAFILSLGPSVKINNTKDLENGPISQKSYMMPKSEATINLPTEKLYTKVPGLKSMRATYRWHVVTMFAMIVIAFYGLELIHRKGHSKIALALALAILIELVPNPSTTYASKASAYHQMQKFNNDVIEPLRPYLNSDDKVIFLPSNGNDYLASYLAASLNVHTQNLNNDKAVAYAKQFRSAELTELFNLKQEEYGKAPILARNLITNGEATVIVLIKFNLRWDSYRWPPLNPNAGAMGDELAKVFRTDGYSVQDEKYFYVVREGNINKH